MQWIHKTLLFLANSNWVPLTIRLKAGCLGIYCLTLPVRVKDKLFGKKRVIVTWVMWDWHYYPIKGNDEFIQIRDIEYRLKRDKLPWFSTKALKGTQVNDPANLPMPLQPHNRVVESITALREGLKNINDRYRAKQAVLNPQFPEVNNDG